MRVLTPFVALALLVGGLEAGAQQAPPANGARDYLKPGDVVKVRIWREADLSGEFLVPENGIVAFPKIGNINVTEPAGATLKTLLLGEYQKYLKNPSMEITFLRRISILGAVRGPGVFSLDETMTVASALALAGGALADGRPDEVQLFRNGEILVTRIQPGTRVFDLPLQSGDQLFVPERSWASRNVSLIGVMVSGVVSLAVAFILKN